MTRWTTMGLVLMLVLVLWSATSCVTNPEPTREDPIIPDVLPAMVYPSDNPYSDAKAELGRHLFYDRRLSADGSTSCASCHVQDRAFSDAPHQISVGVRGEQGQRNSPTLVNVGYRRALFWDGRVSTLEDQALAVLRSPIEMDVDTTAVLNLLRADYRDRWVQAFGDTIPSIQRVAQAIATFERTIVSAGSRYDRFRRGETWLLSEQEREGMTLYFSSRTMCSSCHGGPDLTDDAFHNIGLFHHYFDRGRYDVTRNPYDEGKFKTPTLRNIALTAPYMASGDSEKGVLTTLEAVVKHYVEGGTTFHSKDARVKALHLSAHEQQALVAFLHTLTDSTVLSNPRFSKP
jgi:cytochrome c peroxidase